MLSAFALTNCTQEIDNPAQQPEETGYPFEIVASTVDTKTVNDGMSTKWAEGDQINLFHAVTGSTDYKSNGAFVINDVEAGSFNGNLCEELDVENNMVKVSVSALFGKQTTVELELDQVELAE